jgi:hypothetical protein
MKTIYYLLALSMVLVSSLSMAQEQNPDQPVEETHYRNFKKNRNNQEEHRIKTIFNNRGARSSGGYIALNNKLTSINGEFTNMVELYTGWYINHRLLIGIAGAASTNFVPVQAIHSVDPNARMSYEYMQAGLMTEYVIASDRAIHLAFQLFAGAGGTLQYERYGWEEEEFWDDYEGYDHDEDVFCVAEPGVRVEVNVFKWLRLSPGISYRLTYGSNGKGLGDSALEGTAVNLTLKIGKF